MVITLVCIVLMCTVPNIPGIGLQGAIAIIKETGSLFDLLNTASEEDKNYVR